MIILNSLLQAISITYKRYFSLFILLTTVCIIRHDGNSSVKVPMRGHALIEVLSRWHVYPWTFEYKKKTHMISISKHVYLRFGSNSGKGLANCACDHARWEYFHNQRKHHIIVWIFIILIWKMIWYIHQLTWVFT